jgi:hypothetical protein
MLFCIGTKGIKLRTPVLENRNVRNPKVS